MTRAEKIEKAATDFMHLYRCSDDTREVELACGALADAITLPPDEFDDAEARDAFTGAAREFKDREEAWWAAGRRPGPFQESVIAAAAVFRATYFAWMEAEAAAAESEDA